VPEVSHLNHITHGVAGRNASELEERNGCRGKHSSGANSRESLNRSVLSFDFR